MGEWNVQEIEDLKGVWDKSELSECIRSIGGPLKGYDDIIEVHMRVCVCVYLGACAPHKHGCFLPCLPPS